MLYNVLPNGIYIIHENKEWIPPFAQAFKRANVEFNEIVLTEGSIDLNSPPPKGVFWSRLSASSHTRNNTYSKEYGRAFLSWLESYNRCIINGSSVLELEVSKVKQYFALKEYFLDSRLRSGLKDSNISIPKTIAVFSENDLLESAKKISKPFIIKHNQGGKGLGVRLVDNEYDLKKYIESSEYEKPIDGVTLIQEYIESKESYITRCEFIGGKFHYAVRVDTSNGAFELCPADACEIEASSRPSIASAACSIGSGDKFSLREDINAQSPIVIELELFLQKHNILIAGVEFIETSKGEQVIYDINTNTNYNSVLESKIKSNGGICASDRVVSFLKDKFDSLSL